MQEHSQDPRLAELRAGLETAKAVLQDVGRDLCTSKCSQDSIEKSSFSVVGSFKVWLLEMTAPTELAYEGLDTWPPERVRMEPTLKGFGGQEKLIGHKHLVACRLQQGHRALHGNAALALVSDASPAMPCGLSRERQSGCS